MDLDGEDDAPDAPDAPKSLCILALDDEEFAAEIATMTPWVDQILLRTYGRELTAGRPWCTRWPEHDEAVVRIHSAWLAWQSLTDLEAGATGPSVWQRDHLEPLLGHLRSPDGPFAACTTSPDRPNHRVLAHPEFTDATALPSAA
ncbi:DUF4913 domain-containing protein [Streptacidiphilus sp. MAP5-52]|uniref:DUF4913 domain-containing protein n=1 Tax=Streptacidiphilus sp. MAP5-52 TaxID=3156267 RepID=UPI003516553E